MEHRMLGSFDEEVGTREYREVGSSEAIRLSILSWPTCEVSVELKRLVLALMGHGLRSPSSAKSRAESPDHSCRS